MSNEHIFEWSYDFDLPRDVVWRFVSNTERINRLAGIYQTKYEYQPRPEGGSVVHATAKRRGIVMRYIEEPCQWVEPEYFEFIRKFSGWPLEEMRVLVTLSDGEKPNTTHLHQRVKIRTPGPFSSFLMKIGIGVETRKGFMRAYGQAKKWHDDYVLASGGSEKPKATAALTQKIDRRLTDVLLQCPTNDVSSRLRKLLTNMPDSEIAILRPYALADNWGLSRREVLDFFLHATRGGLLDLRWQVLCPSCRAPKERFKSLSEIGEKGHCDSCNIAYGVNFDRSIEAVFSPEPMGLGRTAASYCHFSPGNSPFRVASITVEAGKSSTLRVDLPKGNYQFASPEVSGADFFESVESGGVTKAELHVSANGFIGIPVRVESKGLVLSIFNEMPHAIQLHIQRTAWADDAVTAAEISSLQEFRDLFGSEALAPGAEFAIQNMVFLFSDLVDSTAMYEAVGDATAFGLVRQHFDVLKEVYESNNGALVKTIGDAVMAVFRDPADAVRAAIRMHEVIGHVRNEKSGHVLALKIGIHAGPCIAMEANGLIDYFGGTVNMSARVQGKAASGELVISDEVLKNQGVRRVLESKGYPKRVEAWQLKGLSGSFELHHVEIGGAREAAKIDMPDSRSPLP